MRRVCLRWQGRRRGTSELHVRCKMPRCALGIRSSTPIAYVLGAIVDRGGKCEDEARRSGAVKSMSTNRGAHCGRRMAASHAFASADAPRAHVGFRHDSFAGDDAGDSGAGDAGSAFSWP